MEHTAEYIVIAVYLAFMAFVGWVMKRFNSNSDDFFRSGARSSWWLLGPSLSLSMTSASVFTAVAGAIFEAGFAPLASNFGQYVAAIILATFLAAWFRQLRAVTGPEVIRERFGPVTHQVFSYLNMLMMPIYGAFQLLGLGIFVSAVFGFPLEFVVLGLGLVVGFYSVSGGKWAVMATDFLQSLTLLPVVVMLGVLCLWKLGGFSGAWTAMQDSGSFVFAHDYGSFTDGRYTWKWVLAVFFLQLVSQLQLGWAARFFAAKDGREAGRAAWLMLGMGVFAVGFFILPSLTAKALYADQVMAYADILNKPQEAAYVVTSQNLLPAGMIGLVIVAMFSATASSMDTGINSNAGVIVRNVVPPLRRLFGKDQLDPQGELRLGRSVSVILVLVIMSVSFYLATVEGAGLFELMLAFASRVQFPIAFPLLLALFIRSAPRSCVLFSMGAGLVLPWLLQPALEQQLVYTFDFADRVGLVAICSSLGFFLSYLFRFTESAKDQKETQSFYQKMLTPVDFAKEVGEANDLDQLVTIGRLTFGVSAGLLLLLLIPNDLAGRGLIFVLGLIVGLIGWLLLHMAKRLRTHQQAVATYPQPEPMESNS